MNGTDNQNLAHGFVQGFNLMNQYQQQQDQEKRQKTQDRMLQERQGWAREQHDHQQNEWQRADDQRLTQAFYQGITSGQVDPKIADEFSNRFGVDLTQYENPKFGQALHVLEGAVKGAVPVRSPEFNQAFQTVFHKDITRNVGETYQGQDGTHQIIDKRVSGVYPGPDGKTLMVDLSVLDRGPNGEQWRNAPVTDNRSATDSNVKAIPLEQALQKLKGHQLLYNAVQNSPQLQAMVRQYAARVGAQLPQDNQYSNPYKMPGLGLVQRGPDNKIYRLEKNKDGKLPALPETAQWMVDNGIARNLKEAVSSLQLGRINAPSYVSNFVTQGMKAQENQGITPEIYKDGKLVQNPDYKNPSELRDMAITSLQEINDRMQHPNGNGSGGRKAPAGLQLLSPSSKPLPNDGSAIKMPDGSYSGKVDRSGSGGRKSKPDAQAGNAKPAPPEALKYLQSHPDLAPQFKAHYGYLPKGF